MKNIIIVIIIILIILGAWFFFGRGTKVEAPIINESQTGNMNDMVSVDTTTNVNEPVVGGYQLPEQGVKEFTVTAKNFSFTPSTIAVKQGDKIKITFNVTEGMHDFKIDEFGAATKQSKAPATETIEFVANKIGTFEYYCSVGQHRAMGMVGKLIVE